MMRFSPAKGFLLGISACLLTAVLGCRHVVADLPPDQFERLYDLPRAWDSRFDYHKSVFGDHYLDYFGIGVNSWAMYRFSYRCRRDQLPRMFPHNPQQPKGSSYLPDLSFAPPTTMPADAIDEMMKARESETPILPEMNLKL